MGRNFFATLKKKFTSRKSAQKPQPSVPQPEPSAKEQKRDNNDTLSDCMLSLERMKRQIDEMKAAHLSEIQALKADLNNQKQETWELYTSLKGELVSLQEIIDTQKSEIRALKAKQAKAEAKKELTKPNQIRFEEFQLDKLLSCGGTAEVFSGQYNGQSVAIKSTVAFNSYFFSLVGSQPTKKVGLECNRIYLHFTEYKQDLFEEYNLLVSYAKNEYEMVTKLAHPNIVSAFGICLHKSDCYIVMEMIQELDLLRYMRFKPMLDWKTRVNILCQIADAISFMHNNDYMHRDIKTNNILIDGDLNVKVCDLASAIHTSEFMYKCGTPGYMAPEVFAELPYDISADSFSFGCVIKDLILYDIEDYPQITNDNHGRVLKEFNASTPSECPPLLKKLALQCLRLYPQERPTFTDIVAELQKIRDDLEAGIDDPYGL